MKHPQEIITRARQGHPVSIANRRKTSKLRHRAAILAALSVAGVMAVFALCALIA
jgi:hypothetical protein